MRDVTEPLRLFVVPPLSSLAPEQRAGAVCVWCPRALPPGEGVDLGTIGTSRLRACSACHLLQSRALRTYLDWYDHGIDCLRCPLGPCEQARVLREGHLDARQRAGKPPLWCVHCRTTIEPGFEARPHLWQGLSGPVYSYVHARRCPTNAP
ncbi:hypothetical protein [Streptomyces spectabilis]|uniref:Uncharacterized protein n=1 Tax=Streptomyces spectabilis TaxID=68270 RepID=A0A5P2XB89_STRST|nr:hypothetical protein [Streptomyces spectabilis]MBB5103309.1 hypothetical protein [Streptomyces spectabilis]MCI3902499.1 hypothetical protein [Streptomyces spectabilis]QEV59836.1 hypothetical protein CP982_14695 [Streptomyces spectabilis]GGV13497.1 hypothetical protein GCM10010245_23550 [Streptomyces spectabilis]